MQRLLAILLILPIAVLLAACDKVPDLPAQALTPAMREKVEDNETYLLFELGTLPKGVTVEAEGFELRPGSGADAGLYQLKLHDVLRVQNTDRVDPFTVTLNLIYGYKGRILEEVQVAYEVSATTFVALSPVPATTTNDSIKISGIVAPGAVATIEAMWRSGQEIRVMTTDIDTFGSIDYTTTLAIGDNEIRITAARLGEAPSIVTLSIKRLEKLATDELKASIREVSGGISIDNGAVERPVPAVALQNALREVYAAPVISEPINNTGGAGLGFIIIELHGKQAQLHVAHEYVVLNDVLYKLPDNVQQEVNSWFLVDRPYDWPFYRWREVLPFEVPQGAGVRTLAIRDEDGPLETLLVVYEEKDDAAVVIDRIIEVAPGVGKFEIHVKKGGTTGRYDAVVIHGWDEHWEFKVIRQP